MAFNEKIIKNNKYEAFTEETVSATGLNAVNTGKATAQRSTSKDLPKMKDAAAVQFKLFKSNEYVTLQKGDMVYITPETTAEDNYYSNLKSSIGTLNTIDIVLNAGESTFSDGETKEVRVQIKADDSEDLSDFMLPDTDLMVLPEETTNVRWKGCLERTSSEYTFEGGETIGEHYTIDDSTLLAWVMSSPVVLTAEYYIAEK